MHPFLQKIEHLRRSGASALEIWPQILRVEKHRRIWEENYPQSQEEFRRWEQILDVVQLAQTGKDISVRKQAISQFTDFREEASVFIPVLIQLLQEKNQEIRYVVIETLGQFEEDAVEALPFLLEALQDTHLSIRRETAWALGELGQETLEVISALINALSDSDIYVRFNAVSALGELGRKSPEAVVALASMLKDLDFDVRRNAASMLGRFGPRAKNAIPALLKTAQDWEWSVRCETAEALGAICDPQPEVISVLLHLFQDTDEFVRGAAVEALGRLGQKTPEIFQAFARGIEDPSFQTRRCLARTLGQFGDQELIPLLLKMLSDTHADVRYDAVIASGEFEFEKDTLQTALFPLLKDESTIVGFEAARILGQRSLKYPDLRIHLEQMEEMHVFYFLEGRVRKALGDSCSEKITREELEKLSTAGSPYFLETVALAYAAKKDLEKAYLYASRAYEDTLHYVEDFLAGDSLDLSDSRTVPLD